MERLKLTVDGKVVVNKSLAEALEELKKRNDSYEFIVGAHARKPKGWETFPQLNGMNLNDLCIALYVGYEIELNKKEQVTEKFQENYEVACTTPKIQVQWYSNGFNDGIEYMNEIFELGLKLKTKPFQ